MDLAILVILTLLNGILAMSELAVASSRRSRLRTMAENNESGAASALQLIARPTQFLSTVQIGSTSIGIINGIVADAAFSESVARGLSAIGVGQTVAPILATALVVAAITFVTIVFGELVPKRIGLIYPEAVARWVAPAMLWLAGLAKPFIWLLSSCTQATLRLLRIDDSAVRIMTEEEISASIHEGVNAGLIEAEEHRMVRNVFQLDDRPLTSLMVPRGEIDWLEAELPLADAVEQVAMRNERAHSWYPVCRGGLDDVVGVISMAQLLRLERTASTALLPHAQPPVFVPETLSAMEMLEHLRTTSAHLMFVVDEYGVLQGLVTPRDLLEAITGELKPSRDSEAWAVALKPGQWLLDGAMPTSELKSRLDIPKLPVEEKGRYNTLAGFLMFELGRVAKAGDEIECAGWRFTITEMQERKIVRILATQAPPHTC